MIVDAGNIGTEPAKRGRLAGPIGRGVLVAVFAPTLFMTPIGLLASWHETFPNATSLSDAILQAVTYAPAMILLDLFGAILTFPVIIAWAVLRSRDWAPWYVCMMLGLATGWLLAAALTSGIHLDSDYGRQLDRYALTVFGGAGLFTGLAVWLASRVVKGHARSD